jgi:hypothetical protein
MSSRLEEKSSRLDCPVTGAAADDCARKTASVDRGARSLLGAGVIGLSHMVIVSVRRVTGALAFVGAVIGLVAACGPGSSSPGGWPYQCEAPRTSGQACVFSAGCAAGLYCGAGGTCTSQAKAGQPCLGSDQCAAGYACTVNLDQDGDCYQSICDSHGACQLGAKAVDKCPIAGGVQQTCAKGETCVLTGSSKPGVCVARPTSGQSCKDLDLPNPCAAGLVCSAGGLCIAPPAAGQPCGRETECAAGLVCVADAQKQTSTCEQPRGLGQSCNAGQCAKGSHCDLKSLVCKANVAAGAACAQGNECGETPLDVGSGVSCVSQKCVQATGSGSACEPTLRPCGAGLVCDK